MQYQVPRKKKVTKNYVKNPFSYDVGTKNEECFTKFTKTQVPKIYIN